jgi:hypothetical protein
MITSLTITNRNYLNMPCNTTNSLNGHRKLIAAAVETSMATAETQALDDDIALLAAMQSGDGDAHDHFTNDGGRRCV